MKSSALRQFVISVLVVSGVLLATQAVKLWANASSVDYRPIFIVAGIVIMSILSAILWRNLNKSARWYLAVTFVIVVAILLASGR